MSKGIIFALVITLVAFTGGVFYGKGSEAVLVMTGSGSGVSYVAPVQKEGDITNPGELVLSGSNANVAGSAAGFATAVVKDGESIQGAVTAAEPGTIIRVMPGTYHETIYIDKDDIRLIGVIEEGRRATLDGEGYMNDAILYSGNNIVIEGFVITNYKGNGIMGQAGNNFEIRNNIIVETGVYGIFPQLGQNGVVELNVISGIKDAAIYIGMSDNIHVSQNEVFDSVAGIEIENSRHAIVEGNYVYNNTGGILAFISPGLPIKTTYDVIIRNNWISANNTKNFGAPGSTVGGIPAGTGIMVMAADDVVIENNIITNNKNIGILVVDHNTAAQLTNVTVDPESDPNSDRLQILDNLMSNNGYEAIDSIKGFMLTEMKTGNPDILAVGPSKGSCIINRHRYTTVGVDDFAECAFTNTNTIGNYLLPPVAPRAKSSAEERAKITYMAVCSGCHTYTGRMIGPPVKVIQALYMDNPQGIFDYITKPVKRREDYPEMPPQNYLDEETRMAVAKYMLSRTR